MNIERSKYTHRLLARFIIEAETAMAISSGTKGIYTDANIIRDANGMPYIPGTSIAGIIRSMIGSEEGDEFWGTKEDGGHGSEIIFTEGKIINAKGEVVDGLNLEASNDELLKHYSELPVRQHVSIDDKGVAKKQDKFDQEVVYAGTRFCFEMEIVSDGEDCKKCKEIVDAVNQKLFHIGGSSRKGLGLVAVKKVWTKVLDLRIEANRNLYLSKSSNLNESASWTKGWGDPDTLEESKEDENWVKYEINICPDDFVAFGSGLGDEQGEVDSTPVRESVVKWDENDCGSMTEVSRSVLIPASSVKGALRHRTIYHYNRLAGNFADLMSKDEMKTAVDNCPASNDIFGFLDGKKAKRGNAIFRDVALVKETSVPQKNITHVKIDRFTGGAIYGALFTEQVDYLPEEKVNVRIYVRTDALKGEYVKAAFEKAIDDLKKGLLSLGGTTNRGHGSFHENK